MGARFRNRADAGRELAAELERFRGSDAVVLALPKGGVPVAFEISRALDLPLDVLVARKIGAPFQPELGVGAIAEGGELVLDLRALEDLGLRLPDVAAQIAEEQDLVATRATDLRRGRRRIDTAGRTVIVVDDGLATGVTARVALRALRKSGAGRLVLAVPVGARASIQSVHSEADEVVCALTPGTFRAVGNFYEDFSQVEDDEVEELLFRASRDPRERHSSATLPATIPIVSPSRSSLDSSVSIRIGGVELLGDLAIPADARGIVLFSHRGGSGRKSPRNRQVAEALQRGGYATLFLDLLSVDEEQQDLRGGRHRFDVLLLSSRLAGATDWVLRHPDLARLPIGYFGASTGAATALIAASRHLGCVKAIVSVGGRPDLAGPALPVVQAPTLLIVGGNDPGVLDLSRDALEVLPEPKGLSVVAGATHVFEEPGALETVGHLAKEWFNRYLGEPPSLRAPTPPGEIGVRARASIMSSKRNSTRIDRTARAISEPR